MGDTTTIGGVGNSLTFAPRANDGDPDGDRLVITAAAGAAHGTVTIVNNGTAVTYTRTTAGDDSFIYTVSDGQGHTKTGVAKVTDTPPGPNQAPTATIDIAGFNLGIPLTFNPLANDTDPDGDTLTITSITAPQYGTATIVNGGKAITFTGSLSNTNVLLTLFRMATVIPRPILLVW